LIPIHLHTHTHTIGHLPGDPRPDRTVAPPPQLTPTRHAAASKERFPIVPIVGERPSASQEGPPVSGSPFGPLVHLSQPPAVRPSSPMPRPPTTNLTSQIDSPCQKTPSSTPLEGRTDDFRGVDFRMEDATTFPSQFSAVRPSSPTPRPPTTNLTSQIDSPCQKTPSSTPLEGRTDDFRGVYTALFFRGHAPTRRGGRRTTGPPTLALRTTARQASGRVDRHHNIKTATVINSCAQYVSRVKTRASAPLPQVVTRCVMV
jgi:hypothetical protein